MQIRSVLSLFAIALFALTASQAQAVPFDLDFATPGPVDCPIEQPVCSNVDVVPIGAPMIPPDVPLPSGAPFLSYAVGGGNHISAAAWTAFTGTIDSIVLGQMRQDIDTFDGGLGVDDGPSDNIDAGESVALFANGGASSFVLTGLSLLNHPDDLPVPTDSFLVWITTDPTLADWDSGEFDFDNIDGLLDELSDTALYAIAFEALDGESPFYLSGVAGDIPDAVIPEPTTALLLGLGVIGLAMRRREV